MTTTVHARYVLGYREGDHVLIEDASVVYDGARIVYAGPRRDSTAGETIDLGEALVTPGLIDLDAVSDIDHALLDSWSAPEAAAGLQWSAEYFTHRRHDVFDQEERNFIRQYGLAQLLLHGITTCMPIASETHSSWAETYQDAVGIAEAARALGIRAYVGPSYRAGVNVVRGEGGREVRWEEQRGLAGLRDAERFLEYARSSAGDGLVRGALLPCRIETMTPELLAATAELARRHDVPVRLHCMQGTVELDLLRREHAATPLEIIERAGLLGCRLLLPHATYGAGGGTRGAAPSDSELETLARAGASIVHCPSTSLRYGMVLDSFDRFGRAGVNITLGSDSFPPDLFRAMDVGSSLTKVLEGRLDAGDPAAYFRAATLNAARALGRDDLGRLAPGAQADLVAVRLTDFRLGVLDDPLRTFLMSGSPRDIALTVVAGRTVVRDGELPGRDVTAMQSRAQRLFGRMRAGYGERNAHRRAAADLFPPVFPRLPAGSAASEAP
ncbi:chlorohydrolase family protein [Streptomyces sp. NPDC088194]|uniref:chlorohydrolase family protein n=1 Tax=Streptomyces sp. NPDC088194 TaxID=3154931 RepID=UPI00344B8D05